MFLLYKPLDIRVDEESIKYTLLRSTKKPGMRERGQLSLPEAGYFISKSNNPPFFSSCPFPFPFSFLPFLFVDHLS